MFQLSIRHTLCAFVLLPAGCAAQAIGDPALTPCAVPSIETSDWQAHDAGRFSFRLPDGFVREDVQGIDSQVGSYRSPDADMHASFDLGWYSNDLSPDSATFTEYGACRETIGGLPATVITAELRNPEEGRRHVAAAAWRGLDDSEPPVHLTVRTSARERSSLDTLHAVLRTVTFDLD